MNLAICFSILCWIALTAYWVATAWNVKKSVYRQPYLARAMNGFFMVLAFLLLYHPRLWGGLLNKTLIYNAMARGILGNALCAFGVSFAIWGRMILGRNWNANVAFKADHELIQRGPYALVRHPIYTGFLFAMIGSAIVVGQARGFVGVLVLFIGFWLKLQAEERLISSHFPEEYPAYRRRVKALFPYIL